MAKHGRITLPIAMSQPPERENQRVRESSLMV
jgi:hypothetical protein